ncbi:hypothetical protein MA16_Dca005376 [Dendrobium catenatum]|uniref:Retrovirus-related Pol polyprotein from transposon TNT 1-94 n=1 Tax=Dendrobium catenatum TaxID=906689 RepID=A0A2I0X3A7_9ASPA|nr:hypothetical protein MA16_Dca005376 [Dendrobium catenatum]
MDFALLNDKPTTLTDTSSIEEKSFHETWEISNRLSLMFMRMTVADIIKPTLPITNNAK